MLALLNVMNMKGELTLEQAHFMAATKPDEELYDLRKDPYEVRNVADDPDYAEVKKELRGTLDAWRRTIDDEGVSDAFRNGGWPADYPLHEFHGCSGGTRPFPHPCEPRNPWCKIFSS